jgi:cytochrome c oxidase assembly protein subunit 15
MPGSGLSATPNPAGAPRDLLERLAVVNLVVQVLIVLTGGLVRLTGSGLGCPTWPQCVAGSYTPVVQQAQGYHKYIEFGNRLLTFVVGVAALAVLVAVVRRVRRGGGGRGLLLLGAGPLLGVLAQAVLGGVTVLTSLNPATVAAHFLLSMVLVSASTALLLAVRTAPVWPQPPRTELRVLAAAVAAVATIVLVLGTLVTGSGPHSGDADAPARFGFDPRAMSWLHADAVLLFAGLALGLLLTVRLTPAPDPVRRRAAWLAVVTLAQGLVGYVQYALGLPEAVVAAHLVGASLLVVAVTAVVLPVVRPRALSAGTDPARPPGTAGSGT